MKPEIIEVAVPQRLRLHWLAEAPNCQPPPQLVQGILPAGCLALLFGEASCGKSTLALDLGLAIATGRPWRGRRTRAGLVVHVAGEGLHGLLARQTAAIRAGAVDPGAPYVTIDGGLDLAQPGDLADVIEAIAAAATECGATPALVILDTLARCFGVDENSGAEMRAAVAAADEIRRTTGAAVLIVHHAGKDTTKGARGHSSLRAAVDVELFVEGRENPRTLTVSKNRDLPMPEPMVFALHAVETGRDAETGEPLTACTVQHLDQPPPCNRTLPRGRNQQKLFGAIVEYCREHQTDAVPGFALRRIAEAQGLRDRRRYAEALASLERDGHLVACTGGHRLAGDSPE